METKFSGRYVSYSFGIILLFQIFIISVIAITESDKIPLTMDEINNLIKGGWIIDALNNGVETELIVTNIDEDFYINGGGVDLTLIKNDEQIKVYPVGLYVHADLLKNDNKIPQPASYGFGEVDNNGEYKIKLRAPFETGYYKINIYSGEIKLSISYSRTLYVQATPTTATVTLYSTPTGANFQLTNAGQTTVGTTPYTYTGTPGTYSITLTKTGYITYPTSLTTVAGRTYGTQYTLSLAATPTPTPSPTPTTTQTPSITATTPIGTITPTATSIPAGATAKCNDGTYSFSKHHQGTCSYHGGVNIWYPSTATTPTATPTPSPTPTPVPSPTPSICTWITDKGGWNAITVDHIIELVDAYRQGNLGFTVTSAHVSGTLLYYLGIIDDGNSLTGCTFSQS